MILLTGSPSRMRTTLLAALLGGVAGGALVPSLTLGLGAPASRAIFAAIAAGLVVLVRGARNVPARAGIAAAAGVAAALLEKLLPTGSAPAIVGLGIALAISPEGTPVLSRLLRGAAGAAFALLGAMGVGLLAGTSLGSTPVAWDAALGGAIGLGAVAGELLQGVVLVSTRPPAELEAARPKLSSEGRAAVDMARGAYVRACEAVIAATSLDTLDRVEALTTARDLALTATRSSLAADEVARARASVNTGAAPTEQLRESRARVNEQLTRKLEKAREDATAAATALAELAIAIAERGATQDTAAEDLTARARGLAFRIGAQAEPVVIPGKEA